MWNDDRQMSLPVTHSRKRRLTLVMMWKTLIAKRTFVLQHGNRAVQTQSVTYNGMLNMLATSAYCAVMVLTAHVCHCLFCLWCDSPCWPVHKLCIHVLVRRVRASSAISRYLTFVQVLLLRVMRIR